MDRMETLKIMAVLRGAYPQFYRNISRKEADDTVGLWQDIFGRYEYSLVSAAVLSFIEADEKGFPPVPGQIAAKIRLIVGGDELTEAEAWGLVAKALRNSGYNYTEEFEALPDIIQRIVGSPSQLHEWAMMDSETVQSVVASNFQRSYKVISQRDEERKKLPMDVRVLLESLSTKMALSAAE